MHSCVFYSFLSCYEKLLRTLKQVPQSMFENHLFAQHIPEAWKFIFSNKLDWIGGHKLPFPICFLNANCILCKVIRIRRSRNQIEGFPDDSVVRTPPASVGDTGCIPGPEDSMYPGATKPCSRAWKLQLLSPSSRERESETLRGSRGATAMGRWSPHDAVKSSSYSLHLEKAPMQQGRSSTAKRERIKFSIDLMIFGKLSIFSPKTLDEKAGALDLSQVTCQELGEDP